MMLGPNYRGSIPSPLCHNRCGGVLAKPALRQAQCSLVHLYEVGVNILDLVSERLNSSYSRIRTSMADVLNP